MARIILVDDEPISSRLVCDYLFDAGHIVGWIGDSRQALAVLTRRPPEVVILDCAMPHVSGVQLLMAMKDSPTLCGVPVLMLTARLSDKDEAIAFGAGADDYLRKPVDHDELLGRIDALLMRHSVPLAPPPGFQKRVAFR